MKFKHVIMTLGLAAVLGLGVGVGLKAGQVKETKAATLASYSGSFGIELQYISGEGTDHYWDAGNAKIAVRMYNTEDVGEMGDCWSDLISTKAGTHNYVIPYTTSSYFDPFAGSHTKIQVYRFNPVVTDPAEGFSEGQYWNHCDDLDMGTMLYVYGWDSVSSVHYYVGKSSNSWAYNGNSALRFAKRNGSNWEVYGDNTLSETDQFKMYSGSDAHAGFSTHASLSTTITGDQYNNISCSKADTYSFYYNLSTSSTYITTPAYAAADEFAQSFISKTSTYCSAEISSSVQSDLKDEYDDLAGIAGAQAAFYNSEVKRGNSLSYTTYASEALSRYVNMQEGHGYTDFLGLGAHNPLTSRFGIVSIDNDSSNTLTIAIVAVSAISLLAVGGFFFIRKRKEDR